MMRCKDFSWDANTPIDDQHSLAHLENCSQCQSKVASLSESDLTWWSDAKSVWIDEGVPKSLDPSKTSAIVSILDRTFDSDPQPDAETVSLSFLSAPTHPELLGRLGRYDIEALLGSGGMGVVLKAHDSQLHRVVAIKVLAQHLATHASARHRFAREAQAAAAILHPNIIPIYDVDADGEHPFLVMQYISGPTLQTRVDRHGPLSVLEGLRIAQQIASGLSAAHAHGVVHRDIKPANILLEDRTERVHICDFGLVRTVDDASLTKTGCVAGTPHYMSPEQANGEAIDYRSDLFSLGAVLYFMLTGRPPFRANGAIAVLHRVCHHPHRPIQEVQSQIPFEVSKLIDRLLNKQPNGRFASAQLLEGELNELVLAMQQGRLKLARPSVASWMRRQGRSAMATIHQFRRVAFQSPRRVFLSIGCGLLLSSLLISLLFSRIARETNNVHAERATNEVSPSMKNPNSEAITLDAWRELLVRWSNADKASTQFWVDADRVQHEVNAVKAINPNSTVGDRHVDPFDSQLASIQAQIEECTRRP